MPFNCQLYIYMLTLEISDIDECEDGQDICRPDQICVNELGEYDCKPKMDLRLHI